MEHILEGAFEDGEITDAAIASSLQDSHTFWHVRESIPLADRTAGGSIHSDVSLPISLIPIRLSLARAFHLWALGRRKPSFQFRQS